MSRVNCWEFKKCGREPGGANASELGVCLAATTAAADGINHGRNGGRVCWVIAGTLCGGQPQGTYAGKRKTCLDCDFYQRVLQEEESGYDGGKQVLERLRVLAERGSAE